MAQAIDPNALKTISAEVAAGFAALPQVEAVALAGSRASDAHDEASDIDLYVYSKASIPPADRRRLIEQRAEPMEIDNSFWEPGD